VELPRVVSAHRDPADCWRDHLLAKSGCSTTRHRFCNGDRVPRAMVLLALPSDRAA
jgi:hypothetical protein